MAAWGGAIGLTSIIDRSIGLSDKRMLPEERGRVEKIPIIHVRGRHQLLFLHIAGDNVGHGNPRNTEIDIEHRSNDDSISASCCRLVSRESVVQPQPEINIPEHHGRGQLHSGG